MDRSLLLNEQSGHSDILVPKSKQVIDCSYTTEYFKAVVTAMHDILAYLAIQQLNNCTVKWNFLVGLA